MYAIRSYYAELLQPLKVDEDTIEYPLEAKKILEKLGVPHLKKTSIILEKNEAKIFFNLLFRKPLNLNDSSYNFV